MPRWERLITAEDCPPGQNRFVRVGTLELALFRLRETGEFVAVPNSCPHSGGNLSAGDVAQAVVTCPWHQWQFDLHTGACVHNELVRIRRYPVRIADGWVWVDLEPVPDEIQSKS